MNRVQNEGSYPLKGSYCKLLFWNFFGGKKTYGQIFNILNVATFTYLIDPTEGQTVEFYSLQKAYDGTICSEEAIESEKAPWTMLRIRQLRLK